MSTVTASIEYAPNDQRNCVLITWSAVPKSDDGSGFEVGDYADGTVQIGGTFGTDGSVTMQGSNDGSNWAALTDPQGSAITKTAAGLEVIEEAPRHIRPSVTAGDGTTAIDVTLWARRGR